MSVANILSEPLVWIQNMCFGPKNNHSLPECVQKKKHKETSKALWSKSPECFLSMGVDQNMETYQLLSLVSLPPLPRILSEVFWFQYTHMDTCHVSRSVTSSSNMKFVYRPETPGPYLQPNPIGNVRFVSIACSIHHQIGQKARMVCTLFCKAWVAGCLQTCLAARTCARLGNCMRQNAGSLCGGGHTHPEFGCT